MRTIYRYELPNVPLQFQIEMPRYAKILNLTCLTNCNVNLPNIYAEVDTKEALIKYDFIFYKTGDKIAHIADKRHVFIGTAVVTSYYVLHLYHLADY